MTTSVKRWIYRSAPALLAVLIGVGSVGAADSPAAANETDTPTMAEAIHAGQADASVQQDCIEESARAGLRQLAGTATLIFCPDTSYILEACDDKPDSWGVRALMGNRDNPLGSRTLDYVDHRTGAGYCTGVVTLLGYVPSALAVTACLVKGDNQKDCNRTILY